MFKKNYADEADITFRAIEPGCCVYVTNEQECIDKYILDVWESDVLKDKYGELVESCDDASEEYVVNLLQKVLNSADKDIESLLRQFCSSDITDYMSINKWEFTELNEMK